MNIDERLTQIETKVEYIIKQEKIILDMMVKFIDHVEEIEALAVQENRIKN